MVETDLTRRDIFTGTIEFSETGDMSEPGLTPESGPDVPVSKASVEIGGELYEIDAEFVTEFVEEFVEI